MSTAFTPSLRVTRYLLPALIAMGCSTAATGPDGGVTDPDAGAGGVAAPFDAGQDAATTGGPDAGTAPDGGDAGAEPDSGAPDAGTTDPCVDVAPAGLLRQTGVTVRTYSPALVRTGVPVLDASGWDNVFGYNYASPGGIPIVPWPGSLNIVTNLRVLPGKYLAIEFHVPVGAAPGAIGVISTTQTGTTIVPVARTLSTCAGDFRSTVPAVCRAELGEGTGIGWALHDEAGTCRLEAGQTYYLNIVVASLADPTTTTCPAGMAYCGFSLQNQVYSSP
jgi:hypothetical protein